MRSAIHGKQKISATFNLVGMSGAQSQTTLDASPDPAPSVAAFPIMAASAHLGRVNEAGAQLSAPNWVQSLRLNIGKRDNEDAEIRQISRYLVARGTPRGIIAAQHLEDFTNWLITRYGNARGNGQMFDRVKKVVEDCRSDMLAGNGDARMTLLEGMLNLDPAAFLLLEDSSSQPEPLLLWERANLTLSRITTEVATLDLPEKRADPATPPARAERERNYVEVRSGQWGETYAVMLATLLGADSLRTPQKLNYNTFTRDLVDTEGRIDPDFVDARVREMAQLFTFLSTGQTLKTSDVEPPATSATVRTLPAQAHR